MSLFKAGSLMPRASRNNVASSGESPAISISIFPHNDSDKFLYLVTWSLVKPHVSPSPSSPPLKGGEIIKPLSPGGLWLRAHGAKRGGEGGGGGGFFFNPLFI